MITKVGKVFGIYTEGEEMDISNLEDANALTALRDMYASKAQEHKTSWKNALLSGGLGGASLGALTGSISTDLHNSNLPKAFRTSRIGPTAYGAALLGALGMGAGALLKHQDDKDIAEAEELKDATDGRLLRTLSESRQIQRLNDE
jgi:hypothetical protein